VLVGISIPQTGRLADVAAVRAAAVAAESMGYSSLWAMDPAPGTAALDPLGALTVAAAVTERIGLGTSVLAAPAYPRPHLVRALTTLEQASGGRLTIGLGLGSAAHHAFERMGRRSLLEAALDQIDGAFPTTAAGHRPAVLLAASTAQGFERIARRADGWNPVDPSPSELEQGWATICELAVEGGRDPDHLRLVVRVTLGLSDDEGGAERRPCEGSAAQVAGDLRALEAAGAHEVVLGWRDDPSLDEVLDRCARVTECLELAAPV